MTSTDAMGVFQEAIAALKAQDFVRLAGLCDPVSLRSFQRSVLSQLDPHVSHATLTVEQLMQAVPDMPKEVAEYQTAQYRRDDDPARRLERLLPGFESVEAAHALDAGQLFSAWIEARSPRRIVEREVAAGRAAPEMLAVAAEFSDKMYDFLALGAVEDGARMAYVLHRIGADGSQPQASDDRGDLAELPDEEYELSRETEGVAPPQVARCIRQPDGSWRLYADYDFLSLGSFAIQVGTGREESPDHPPERAS